MNQWTSLPLCFWVGEWRHMKTAETGDMEQASTLGGEPRIWRVVFQIPLGQFKMCFFLALAPNYFQKCFLLTAGLQQEVVEENPDLGTRITGFCIHSIEWPWKSHLTLSFTSSMQWGWEPGPFTELPEKWSEAVEGRWGRVAITLSKQGNVIQIKAEVLLRGLQWKPLQTAQSWGLLVISRGVY